MSGGSYEYLCVASPHELPEKEEQLKKMFKRLARLGYAMDAAIETAQVRFAMKEYYKRMEVMTKRLQGVWKAVEWMDSGDWAEEDLIEALEKYRNNGDSKGKQT